MLENHDEKFKPLELPELIDEPLVSVLIPNYNYAHYIGDALESVLHQTYSNFEVIVCDDGSTDNSCEVVNTYIQKNSRIKLVRKSNGGPASAWNAAYRESKGEIICLLDADDIWLHDKLQKVINAFHSQPNCGLVFHNVIQIDRQGELIKHQPMLSKFAEGWTAPFALKNGGFVDNIPPTSALSFRREVTELLLPMNETFLRNVDAVVRNLAAFVTLMQPIPEILSKYRIHGSNIMAASSLKADFLEKELARSELVHQEVEQFVRSFHGAEIAEKLASVKCRLTYCHNKYLVSRLTNAPKSERTEAHRQLISHPEFAWSGMEGFLLKRGEYLPNVLFKALFNQIYGSGELKQIVRILRKKFIGSPLKV
ncbi:MAG: glycosyltransferase [Rivularia sp. T60_A2020_040]|nr:glycosyltransferase [Rivularia sp. T60_A2020_040]